MLKLACAIFCYVVYATESSLGCMTSICNTYSAVQLRRGWHPDRAGSSVVFVIALAWSRRSRDRARSPHDFAQSAGASFSYMRGYLATPLRHHHLPSGKIGTLRSHGAVTTGSSLCASVVRLEIVKSNERIEQRTSQET